MKIIIIMILNFIKNYIGFAFVIFMFILFFYISVPDMHCEGLEKKEWDFLVLTKENNLKYVSNTSLSANSYELSYIHKLGGIWCPYIVEADHLPLTRENNLIHQPDFSYSRVAKKMRDVYKRRNFFLPKNNYLTSEIISFENFVKKEIEKCEEEDYDTIEQTVNAIMETVFLGKASKINWFNRNEKFSIPALLVMNDIINFEVRYDYLIKELVENDSAWVNLVLKKNKIENKNDISYACEVLNELNTRAGYKKIYKRKSNEYIWSITNTYSNSNIFLGNDSFYCEKFYSRIFNKSYLVYSPNPTFYCNKFMWHIWFEICKDLEKEKTYLNFYCRKPISGYRYTLAEFDYLFDFENEELISDFEFNEKKRNNFYAAYKLGDKIIDTKIFFYDKNIIRVAVGDNNNLFVYDINVLNGEIKEK